MDRVAIRVRQDSTEWEQIAAAEVLVPGVPNVFGDLWSEEAIRRAAYMFMERGFGIDVNHDNQDVSYDVKVVESFIARENDPDFIKGSWVVFVHILDGDLWQMVLDGKINGFSYEALVGFDPAYLEVEDSTEKIGITEPSVEDGHTHDFYVVVDSNNRPLSGGTGNTNGHSHTITTHTVTDEAEGHVHRYQLVKGVNGG